MKETLTSGFNLGMKSNLYCIYICLTKKNIDLSKYLFKNGFLNSYVLNKSKKKIILYFSSYYNKKPILYIKKISSPGRKVYISWRIMKKILIYKNNFLLLSTNRGFLTNREAVSQKIGGELIFFIKC